MFKHSNVKRNQIDKLMNQGHERKKYTIRKMREESYQELIDDLSKRKTFDKTLMNQKTSPTSRTPVRSWKQQRLNELQEQRQTEFERELEEIIGELES